jgi:hypothetical protein
MRWFLGCLSVIFVVFGGCVFVTSLVALPGGSDVGFLTVMLLIGVAVFIFGVWVFYKAVTMYRTPTGAVPPDA